MTNYKRKGKSEYEHRLKMGCVKGDKKIVHHKDGNKKNNDPSNLEVLSYSEHNKQGIGHGNHKYSKEEARKRELERKLKWWHKNKKAMGYVKEEIILKCKSCGDELPEKHPKYFCSDKCKREYEHSLGSFERKKFLTAKDSNKHFKNKVKHYLDNPRRLFSA